MWLIKLSTTEWTRARDGVRKMPMLEKINEIIANWNRCAFHYENYYKSSEFYLVSDCKWFFCFSAVVVLVPSRMHKKMLSRKNFHSFLWLTGSLVAFCSTPNRRHPLADFFSCIWRDSDKLCVLLKPLGVFFRKARTCSDTTQNSLLRVNWKINHKTIFLASSGTEFFIHFAFWCFIVSVFYTFGVKNTFAFRWLERKNKCNR